MVHMNITALDGNRENAHSLSQLAMLAMGQHILCGGITLARNAAGFIPLVL